MQNPYRRRPNPASPGPLTYGAAPPPTNPYAAAAQRPAVSVTVHAPVPTGVAPVAQQTQQPDDPIARLLADPSYQQLSPEIRGFLQSRTGQPVGQAPVPSQPLVAQPDGTVGHAAPQTSRIGMATVQTPAAAPPQVNMEAYRAQFGRAMEELRAQGTPQLPLTPQDQAQIARQRANYDWQATRPDLTPDQRERIALERQFLEAAVAGRPLQSATQTAAPVPQVDPEAQRLGLPAGWRALRLNPQDISDRGITLVDPQGHRMPYNTVFYDGGEVRPGGPIPVPTATPATAQPVSAATPVTPAPAAPPPPAPVQLPPGFERSADQSGAPAGQMTIVNPTLGLTQNVPDPTYVAPVAAPQAQAPAAVAATMANPPPPAPLPASAASLGPLVVGPDGVAHGSPPPPAPYDRRQDPNYVGQGSLAAQAANAQAAAEAQRQANPNYRLQQQQLAQQGWSTVGESAGDGSGFYVRPDWQPGTEPDAARFTRGYVNYAAKAFGLPDEDRRQLLGMTDDALKNWLAGGFSKLIPKAGSGGYADPRTQDILRQYAGGAYKAKPPEAPPSTPPPPPAPPPPAKSPEEQERDAVKGDPEAVALAQRLGVDLDKAAPADIKRVREAAERGRANRYQPAGAWGSTAPRR